MGLDETLYKIQCDLEAGNFGKARDRLHGLLSSYPNNLDIRRRLGLVYWDLKYPVNAGRYWYLQETKTPEMIKACKEFEENCGNHPFQILRSLKFKGDINQIGEHARLTIMGLQKRAKQGGFKEIIRDSKYQKIEEKLVPTLLIIVVILLIVFMVIGFTTVIKWIF